jgi:hypothetical protein
MKAAMRRLPVARTPGPPTPYVDHLTLSRCGMSMHFDRTRSLPFSLRSNAADPCRYPAPFGVERTGVGRSEFQFGTALAVSSMSAR